MIKFREEKGFTLVEILITLLIVGIVFIPMIIFLIIVLFIPVKLAKEARLSK